MVLWAAEGRRRTWMSGSPCAASNTSSRTALPSGSSVVTPPARTSWTGITLRTRRNASTSPIRPMYPQQRPDGAARTADVDVGAPDPLPLPPFAQLEPARGLGCADAHDVHLLQHR